MIDKDRLNEISRRERDKRNGYTPFSKKEADDLVKWAKESGTAPDLEPWGPEEKAMSRAGKRIPSMKVGWLKRLKCIIFRHQWSWIYFLGGEECKRCGKYRSDSELFKAAMRKPWWKRISKR